MTPTPNVLAGALIGYASASWTEVMVATVAWPVIYCVYVSLIEQSRAVDTAAQFRERGRRLLFGSPASTFFAIEFIIALLTAFPVACIVFVAKRVFE